MARKPFLAVLLFISAARLAFAAPAPVALAHDGKPAATIVIAREATQAAQFAAYELQWRLKQITGGDFLIAKDDCPNQRRTPAVWLAWFLWVVQ